MVAGDHHLRLLADDVAAEADPRPTGKFELHARGLAERLHDGVRQVRRLQHDEQAARPTRERGQPMQPLREPGRPTAGSTGGPAHGTGLRRTHAERRGQVDEQDVHRPTLEQRAGDAQPFIRGLRREDHEPFQPHAAGDGLNRVERTGEVQVRDDRPAGLGLRGEAQRQRGLAAGRIAVHRDTGRTRQTARAEDRIESREAGGDDAPVVCRDEGLRFVQRHCCKRADDHRDLPVPHRPRSCATPASLKGRKGRRDLR